MPRRSGRPEYAAMAFAALGESDQALMWLEEAFREHDPYVMPLLRVVPEFESLHGDGRFNDLVRRIGIPQK